MKEYKRIEIIICSSFDSDLEESLIKQKVANFQIIPHLHGKNFSDDPAEVFQNSLFFFSVEARQLKRTLKSDRSNSKKGTRSMLDYPDRVLLLDFLEIFSLALYPVSLFLGAYEYDNSKQKCWCSRWYFSCG